MLKERKNTEQKNVIILDKTTPLVKLFAKLK